MKMRAMQLGAMKREAEERILAAGEREDAEELSARAQALAEVPAADEIVLKDGRTVQRFDPVRQSVFIQALREKPIVGRAARAAGMGLGAVYRKRRNDPAFALAWDEAVAGGIDRLEEAAVDRAIEKSDKLLEFLLKGMRPEVYREKIDVSVGRRDIVVDLVPGDFVPSRGPEDDDVDEDA